MGVVHVSPEDMEAVSAKLTAGSGEIDAKLLELHREVQDMATVFQGQAAEAFQGLFERWNSSGKELNEALSGIAEMLNRAAGVYRDTDTQIASQFNQ